MNVASDQHVSSIRASFPGNTRQVFFLLRVLRKTGGDTYRISFDLVEYMMGFLLVDVVRSQSSENVHSPLMCERRR